MSTLLARRAADRRLPWWVKGDWNGLFGLGTNVLLNVIVLTGLCLASSACRRHGVRPDPAGPGHRAAARQHLVRGPRPPAGPARGPDDVTALPYGPSVPHMFIVVFVVMLPVHRAGRPGPGLAGRAGLGIHHRVIVLFGALVGPWIRGGRRGRRCWARSPASRSRSSPCARRRRCGRRRGSPASRCVHPRRLARFPADAGGRPRRTALGLRRDRGRLDRRARRLVRHPRAVGGVRFDRQLALHLPFPGGDVLTGCATSPRCWRPRSRWASTTSPKA